MYYIFHEFVLYTLDFMHSTIPSFKLIFLEVEISTCKKCDKIKGEKLMFIYNKYKKRINEEQSLKSINF